MGASASTIFDILAKLKSELSGHELESPYKTEEPLRSDLLNSEQMERHSKAVAHSHELNSKQESDKLLPRLDENEVILLKVHELLNQTVDQARNSTLAGEWLLDNFYLIEEQIRFIKKHLPPEYCERLTQLKFGPAAGLPRVYDIALEIVSHSDGRIDMEVLNTFIFAYQSVKCLRLGELWALPLMLRLALIENLRRVCTHIATDRINRNIADLWAKRMLETAESDPKSLVLVLADMARSNPPLERAFVAELNRQLGGKGHVLAHALHWVEDRLIELGLSSSELVHSENEKQAAHQVSVSNSIGSLRIIDKVNWCDFVELHSVVEKTLNLDETYASMDFSTRDQYRHVIEHISKYSASSEEEVATLAIQLSQSSAQQPGVSERKSHVGYYLIGPGRVETEKSASARLPILERVCVMLRSAPLLSYFFSAFVLSAALMAELYVQAKPHSTLPFEAYFVTALVIVCCSDLALKLINTFSSLILCPRLLPRLDYTKGIPDSARSIVIIPGMLSNHGDIEAMIEALEVRFLANKDSNLYFGLITDFEDAAQETLPSDVALLDSIQEGIHALNRKYSHGEQQFFYLFHRPRRWNVRDKIWMGYERKRGKIREFNGLLRGNSVDCFSHIIGNLSTLQTVKYIITLDVDTLLPRDSARKMIASICHPLNRAFYDSKQQRVTSGYGILQPRVSTNSPQAQGTLYAKLHAGDSGIDPYTRATSDTYQDIFDEGSFIGKGIYEVDVFEKALKNTFPPNSILSHDLLEGCYARAGLLSDVQLFENSPSAFIPDMKRRHRWIRGDWQIAVWCLPFIPDAQRKFRSNTLSMLSRWKIFDNLRRSVVPICFVLFYLLAWTRLQSPLVWTAIISSFYLLPEVVNAIVLLLRKPSDRKAAHHLQSCKASLLSDTLIALFRIASLPYEAFINFDAIVRTLWRLIISRRSLLQWNTAQNTERGFQSQLLRTCITMWIGPVLGIVVGMYLILTNIEAAIASSSLLLLWIISPAAAWWISIPLRLRSSRLKAADKTFLRILARKKWAYFEDFVNSSDSWLPPDNYQLGPVEILAHRTSPTNIGLSLLSTLSAYDFGYLSMTECMQRCDATLTTMKKMERFRGHFFNWYDTRTLRVLWPRYISTVDSGNLSGHLLTLRQGFLEMQSQPIVNLQVFDGILDILSVLITVVPNNQKARLLKVHGDIDALCGTMPQSPSHYRIVLLRISAICTAEFSALNNCTEMSIRRWINSASQLIHTSLQELDEMCPHLSCPQCLSIENSNECSSSFATLRDLSRAEQWLTNAAATSIETQNSATAPISPDSEAPCRCIHQSRDNAQKRIAVLEALAHDCEDLAYIEFDFLYNKNKQLLSIGYNVEEHRCDTGYYDLLASEARLSSFIGIAQGLLPQESWFALGRLITTLGDRQTLLSWGGSMFEYLMPFVVMPTYENTLLDQSRRSAVERQIEYGKQQGVPWGVSESAYNMVDATRNYQYQAFGVPGLGIKRGLEQDLVIAPYASELALMVLPEEACENLKRMTTDGFEGDYGLYEAMDYTPSRMPRGMQRVLIKSYMSHHLGMGFLSIAYVLLGQAMQRRFEAEPRFQATLLLLQERIPKGAFIHAHTSKSSAFTRASFEPEVRAIINPNTAIPEVQLLSNGRYHLMISNSGSGYSRYNDLAVTRWREDSTCDSRGIFCYLRDLDTGAYWSSTYQPTLVRPDTYEAAFSQGRADFRVVHLQIETRTEIVISPEDDIELRRIHITNRSSRTRSIEFTSYAEVVIEPTASEAVHPVFSSLFIQTEIIPSQNCILCTRRPRSTEEQPNWMFHLLKVHDNSIDETSFETDRSLFIGRGNTTANPSAMRTPGPLSHSQGSVLDPIVAIRNRCVLAPGESITVDTVYGIAKTKELCHSLVDKYQDKHHKDRVFELAWTHSQVVLRQINASEADAQLYCRLASSIIYMNSSLRADPSILLKNKRGQAGLWPYAISGDLPIVLLKIEENTDVSIVRQLIQAHSFWRLKGLAVDLVIWNDSHSGYRQEVQNQIIGLMAAQPANQSGAIFVRASEHMSTEDRVLFHTVARVIISSEGGSIADHVQRKPLPKVSIPYLVPSKPRSNSEIKIQAPSDLQFFHGMGGFSSDGTEYVILSTKDSFTPAPWVNVIANDNFGTVISESGQAYTWCENAHEMRLSPWENDPVSDTASEVFYIRDEESGHFWSPTSLPVHSDSPYLTRHGFGYSTFEHEEDGIHSELRVFVDSTENIKLSTLTLKNLSTRSRRLSVTAYTDLVLGEQRHKSSRYIVSEMDASSGAILAHNPYNTEFADRVCFFGSDLTNFTFTADRTDFIGRNRRLSAPVAMTQSRLSGRIGAGLEPCAAIQGEILLAPGKTKVIHFKFGLARNLQAARELLEKFRDPHTFDISFQTIKDFWSKTLQQIQIHTPDGALNILANGWLNYQTLSSRFWGRSGYYQSSGAFGFRDQLQDTLSLVSIAPELCRKHIVLCASRQFHEGDVQHWWHMPINRGVRTRCSDDLLWLVFACVHYVNTTGDESILHEQVHYVNGRELDVDEESYYDRASTSANTESVYLHCKRAIMKSLRFGQHGLSLIGSGDWNDGMDRVGIKGKGESVWLSFFLFDVLMKFSLLSRRVNEIPFANECEEAAKTLQENIAKHAWDGSWFLRAYFDSGESLGSHKNDECKIDSIAQSWSVLSGAGDSQHTNQALQSATSLLVDEPNQLIKLLDPPFSVATPNPGYIAGYVPGIRENGGQYTHAAVWLLMALSKASQSEQAWKYLPMLNPINHALAPRDVQRYKVEPYVVSADIYSSAQHAGRGGWTWYTGAAGWMNQFIFVSLLGLQRHASRLTLQPTLPREWTTISIDYVFGKTTYHISVNNSDPSSRFQLSVENQVVDANYIDLVDDGVEHWVSVCIPRLPLATSG